MRAAEKTPPIELRLRPGTPRKVLNEIKKRYHDFVIVTVNDAPDYFETAEHRKVAASLTPGKSLHHLREAHGLTQAELGEKAGVSAARVSDWENGQRGIPKAAAKRFAELFKVSADRFI